MKKQSVQKAREKALEKVGVYQKLFNSREGEVILKDLEDEFENKSLVSDKAHIMHVRIGELNVIRYIKTVLNVDTTEESNHA